jgi:DNA-binding GntR family transcriptional regulator
MAQIISPGFKLQFQASNSLPELAYQAIHDGIICGRIKPGEPLRQMDLAAELGTSARTIREALSRLVAEGLAEAEPHRGVRVASITIEDQEQLYRMRASIEGMAFEDAAGHISAEELKRLREILPYATQNPDPRAVEIARHNNEEFHWIIIRASGKRQIIRILSQIWKLMFCYFVQYELGEDQLSDARKLDVTTHEAILEALIAGDGKRARALLEKHVLVTFESQRLQMKDYLTSSAGPGFLKFIDI